jgi:hypothetical protein
VVVRVKRRVFLRRAGATAAAGLAAGVVGPHSTPATPIPQTTAGVAPEPAPVTDPAVAIAPEPVSMCRCGKRAKYPKADPLWCIDCRVVNWSGRTPTAEGASKPWDERAPEDFDSEVVVPYRQLSGAPLHPYDREWSIESYDAYIERFDRATEIGQYLRGYPDPPKMPVEYRPYGADVCQADRDIPASVIATLGATWKERHPDA